MKYALLTLLFSGLILIGCTTSNKDRPLSEMELKQQLKQKECLTKTNYISGKCGYQPIYKNALSLKVKGLKLNLELTSKASLAVYQDIKANVKFLAKTGGVVLKREIVIHEFLQPGKTIKTKYEIDISNQQFKDIEGFEWSLVGASCR